MTYTNEVHSDFIQSLEQRHARHLYRDRVIPVLGEGKPVTVTTTMQAVHDELVRLSIEDKLSCEVDYSGNRWYFTFVPDVQQPTPVRPPVNVDGEPVVENEQGGLSSKLEVDMTLLPYDSLEQVARVLTENCDEYGGSYPRANWRKLDRRTHLNHAVHHLLKAANGSEVDLKELAHAGCRVLFALATLYEDEHHEPEP